MLGYSQSSILKKPTSMLHTVTIPSKGSRTQAVSGSNELDPTSTPYPRAYQRTKEFLKKMLQRELEADERSAVPRNLPISILIHKVGSAPQIVDEFRRQILAYTRQEYPFNEPFHDDEHIVLRPLATTTASLMRNLIPMVLILALTMRMMNSTLMKILT